MNHNNINTVYQFAKEQYAELGVDTNRVLENLQKVEISVHCWQGDDLIGFEAGNHNLSGGILATGNYLGRARNSNEIIVV